MNKVKYYRLFGLTLKSPFNFPELEEIQPQNADIRLNFGPISEDGLESPSSKRLFFQASTGCLWLNIRHVGRFLIQNGNEIIVDAYPNSDKQNIRLYILGSCMGAILHQRGFLTLHANAIVINKKAVLFAGASGVGKSTLAAAFHQRGYQILTDDVCAIDLNYQVIPGIPQIKLWQDSANQLDIPTSALNRIRCEVNKYSVPIKNGFCSKRYPVDAVVFLNTHNNNNIALEASKGWQCYEPLRKNTYRKGFLEGMGYQKKHLLQCSHLSKKAKMWNLYRPRDFQLEALVDMLLQHFDKVPQGNS